MLLQNSGFAFLCVAELELVCLWGCVYDRCTAASEAWGAGLDYLFYEACINSNFTYIVLFIGMDWNTIFFMFCNSFMNIAVTPLNSASLHPTGYKA